MQAPALANDASTILAMQRDPEVARLRRELYRRLDEYRYTYNFTWLSRPIIQTPEDMFALQEIIASVRPDLIVETGVAHGGSLVFYASMLELLGGDGLAVGIDVEIRPHNLAEIQRHAMRKRIHTIVGSSIDPGVVRQVYELARGRRQVMVVLDSNHTHEHVLRELQSYSPLVRTGSYIVVFDTGIEDVEADAYPDRPWGKGNNPKTAVFEFLAAQDRFAVDCELEARLILSAAPHGFLRCVKD